jgi:hypothetical protein
MPCDYMRRVLQVLQCGVLGAFQKAVLVYFSLNLSTQSALYTQSQDPDPDALLESMAPSAFLIQMQKFSK